ncbi:MAG: DUF4129 domain-containing protein [Deltaproteobacteria bacterium]|nr:MAG: DUF4129 domain-containing protein [Deltaproteobacteria bacterium]
MRAWFGLSAALWLSFPWAVQAQGRNNPGWKELRRLRYSLSLKVPTQLNFRIVRDSQGRPQLVGRLRNDKNEGVPNQPLHLTFPNAKSQMVITDAQGQFRKHTIGWPRQGNFRMQFAGSRRFAPTFQKRKLDLRRVDLNIKAVFPPPLPTGTKSFFIDVKLSYKNKPLRNLPVTLSVQNGDALQSGSDNQESQPGSPLMTLYSDRQGQIRFFWQGKELQGPAQLSMVLAFPGTTYFLPQQVRNVLVVTPEIVPPTKIPWEALLYVGLVLGLLGLLVWGWRQGWFERGSESQPELLEKPSGPIDTGRIERVDALEGLAPLKDSYSVGGVVLAVGEARALSYVSVTVKPTDSDDPDAPVWETVTNEKGHFMLRCEHLGRVDVTFFHPHFQTKTTTLTLPQPGKPRLLRVYMASYRHLIYETFFEVTRRTSSKQAFDPKKQTAREWLAALKPEVADSLDPLAKAFEKAYYGSIIPTAEDYDVLCDLFQTQTKVQP